MLLYSIDFRLEHAALLCGNECVPIKELISTKRVRLPKGTSAKGNDCENVFWHLTASLTQAFDGRRGSLLFAAYCG